MDDSENKDCPNTENKLNDSVDKSAVDSTEISPLGISRYGRTRKPKISQDFCSIDDAINENTDDDFVKPAKIPKPPNKLKIVPTNINGVHTSLKETIIKPKHRTLHNNNTEIVHITGDSDLSNPYVCKSKENASLQSSKVFKTITEQPKLPIKNISVTKERIPEIKNKQLSDELKPILSEEIFQTPSINVAEVFKIISNKPNEIELESTAKQNSKGTVKTYTNKRKSFQKQSTLIESFGLPDVPIVPVNSDEYIKPIRISEIDVDIVKPESVNLIDRELIDSLWKIGSAEDNYCCHDNNEIGNIPVFDIRSRFTPDRDVCDENARINKNRDTVDNKSDIKINSANDSIKSQSKYKILKSNTEENVISISTRKLKNDKKEKEEKQVIIKKMINKNVDINKSNEQNFKNSSLLPKLTDLSNEIETGKYAKKTRNNFQVKSKFPISPDLPISKKGICELVYERGNDSILKNKTSTVEVCDIEEHIKISLIDKSKKQEIFGDDSERFTGSIDINKLKNQINSRMEMMRIDGEIVKVDEKVVKVDGGITKVDEDIAKVDDGITEIVEEMVAIVVEGEVNNQEVEKIESETIPIVEPEVPIVKEVETIIPDTPKVEKDEVQFKLGELMWAKIGRYPYWPCLITKDPESDEYKKSNHRSHMPNYHVRFFGDNGRRSWISIKYLLPYDTDLEKFQEENKNEVVIPNKTSKSYKQWLIGCEEANNLKAKTRKQKFQFFKEIVSNKRRYRKLWKENDNKLSNTTLMKAKGIAKRTIRKRIIKPTGTEKLRDEILKNLADILTTEEFKRTTRSSLRRRNSIKSLGRADSRDEIDETEMLDHDSKKHDSSSHCSEDEINNKSLPFTLESQITLYKRNNLFKGVSKERVCQICEKPEGIVKCKGRCNGYYHVLCANRKENANTSGTVSIADVSLDMEELRPANISEESQIQVEMINETKREDIDEINIKVQSENNDNIKIKDDDLPRREDKKLAQKKSKIYTVLNSDDTNGEGIEQTSNKEFKEFKEEQKSARRSRRRTRNDVTDIPRRVTRSQSQEPEIAPRSTAGRKRRRANSQCNSVSEDLEEIVITSFVNNKIKNEIQTDNTTCEITLCDINNLNEFKQSPPDKLKNEIEDDDTIKKTQDSTLKPDRRITRGTYNADHQKDDTKDELIEIKEDIKVSNDNKNCNVKIVHIKDRKKTGVSPKLTLSQDPEFEKLSLHDQIDQKMKEIMQKFDKKTLYADSTTDYTSSEESAVDLLSPQGKKLIVDSLSQDLGAGKIVLEDEAIINMINIIEKKTMQMRAAKHNKSEQQQNEIDFKCSDCLEDIDHPCFVCHKDVSRKGSSIRQKCSLFACGKFYHAECLKVWPQTQWSVISTTKHKQSNTNLDTFVCPVHVCHTCVSDDPRAAIPRCTSDKVAKCLRCPATYHNSAYCIPAGTEILSYTQIICPRHLIPKRRLKRALPIINTTWCFICSEGGDLVCCETCPTSVHSECLKINLTEDDTFICEDCETGRFPLYDEIVWVKMGNYRWWPGIILFPNEIPEKVKITKHLKGEFVVKFFGTYNHYWIGRGRVFLFQEGDSGEAADFRKKKDAAFIKSIEEATEAHRIKKEFKQAVIEEAAIKSKYKPPHYIKIKVNRPVGNVRQFDGNISNTTPCECNPKSKNPCGADSDCLNRLLLTECNPEVCPAGEKCQNQNFEKRKYPPLVPYKTEGRGWGLKSLESLTKGQFVIEYVGEMIDEQEYQRRIKKMHEQKEENYYFLTIDKDRMLDAGPKGNVARFMNHSCQPNCETQKWTVNGDTRVGLFAVDDVPENTELTFNYNLECVGKEKKICKCGAPNCSGFIGVKAKQEELRKISKSKLKHRRKKISPLSEPANKKPPCFVCGKDGDVAPCNNKICTKSYHLQCVNLDHRPDNKWVCPWHNCNICTKRTIRCCVKCLNSYCPVHSEGNVRYDRLLGFICLEHDPNKADLQEIKVDNIIQKDNLSPPKITEENDVTSTTSDEQDRVIPQQPPNERQMTPHQLSDNEEVVTSTPIKLVEETREISTAQQIETKEIDSEAPLPKRKRGRPRKDERFKKANVKKMKLSNEIKSKAEDKGKELEKRLVSTRSLRTPKPVNYSGVSEKLNVAQKKRENDLPIRKRSSVRCEAMV